MHRFLVLLALATVSCLPCLAFDIASYEIVQAPYPPDVYNFLHFTGTNIFTMLSPHRAVGYEGHGDLDPESLSVKWLIEGRILWISWKETRQGDFLWGGDVLLAVAGSYALELHRGRYQAEAGGAAGDQRDIVYSYEAQIPPNEDSFRPTILRVMRETSELQTSSPQFGFQKTWSPQEGVTLCANRYTLTETSYYSWDKGETGDFVVSELEADLGDTGKTALQDAVSFVLARRGLPESERQRVELRLRRMNGLKEDAEFVSGRIQLSLGREH